MNLNVATEILSKTRQIVCRSSKFSSSFKGAQKTTRHFGVLFVLPTYNCLGLTILMLSCSFSSIH